MIHKDLGFAELIITDADFGPVVPGDETFADRLKQNGIQSTPEVWMDQQHTPLLASVESEGILPATDGCFTTKNDLMLITKTADCVPIVLWNEKAHLVAVLHCGWKGFVADIIDSLAALSHDDHPAFGEDFKAYLGPHLRVENFEIQQDFIDALPDKYHYLVESHFGKHYFNLSKGVVNELQRMKITHVEDCGIDTYTNDEFFSYRKWCHTSEEDRPEKYPTFATAVVMKA